jgi:monoamine oxidase
MKIAIIGGGPGGLMTAYHLLDKTQTPLQITIFEASYRLGGKILTKQFNAVPAIYEAGVAELYLLAKGEDPLRELLEELEFTFTPMAGDGAILDGKVISDVSGLKQVFGANCWRAVPDFINEGKKYRSPAQYAGAGWPADNKHPWFNQTFQEILEKVPNAQARRYLEVVCKSDLATEASQTNGTFGFDNYLVDEEGYCTLYTIDGGIEKMVHALHEEIAEDTNILLNAPVKRIIPHGDGYQVISQANDEDIAEAFDCVMVCLPQQWLSSIEYLGDLAKPMADHAAYYYYPAHYLRVAALFKNEFWKKAFGANSYIKMDSFGGCCLYDEGSRYSAKPYGILNWLLAGSPAEAMSNYEDGLIITRALESLPKGLGGRAKQELIEAHVHRWVGSVNAQPGGNPIVDLTEKHSPAPKKHPKIVMVGDYLFDSTLNGLLDSSDLATTLLLQRLDRLKPGYRANPKPRKYPLSNKVRHLLRHAR